MLGADSTSTHLSILGEKHYFNHAQKLFEIGDGGTLGVVTWGLGGLAINSYRKLFAVFADQLAATPAISVLDAVTRWSALFWAEYKSSALLTEFDKLRAKPAHGSGDADERTETEESIFAARSQDLCVGFCLGGYVEADRSPQAYQMLFDPLAGPPAPVQLTPGSFMFFGAPNIMNRLMFGCDDELLATILSSGKWTGSPQELLQMAAEGFLGVQAPLVPIRDAVDFVHFGIVGTIKAFKFSKYPQICGGPVEIAVITADRPFRWVKHKDWDSAITEGGL